jgi:Group XII secretory phospholipase A2 precursor (PLA2G12)
MKLKFLKSLWIFLLSPVLLFDNSSAVAKSSGCGSGSSWYLLRIGSPIAANQFRVACNEHDACYDIFGKSKQECDRAFHNRMLGTCARDHNTWLGKPLKIACNGRADAYYTGVLENAQAAYDKAQEAAKPITAVAPIAVVPQGEARLWSHAPNGDFSKAHSDTIINYLTGDGTRWTAKLVGNTFIHAPNGDFSKAHTDTVMNYVTWDGTLWTIRIVGKTFIHAPNGDFSKSHPDKIMNYVAGDGTQWTAKLL